jgi:hypothetical protein
MQALRGCFGGPWALQAGQCGRQGNEGRSFHECYAHKKFLKKWAIATAAIENRHNKPGKGLPVYTG